MSKQLFNAFQDASDISTMAISAIEQDGLVSCTSQRTNWNGMLQGPQFLFVPSAEVVMMVNRDDLILVFRILEGC